MNKTDQDTKIKIKLIKKIQNEVSLETEHQASEQNLQIQVSPTIYKRQKRDCQALKTEKIDAEVKENVKYIYKK